MPREVFRCGQRVQAKQCVVFLTGEEVALLRRLAGFEGRSQGEYLGNMLRNADIRARRLESENAAEERRVFRLRAGGET